MTYENNLTHNRKRLTQPCVSHFPNNSGGRYRIRTSDILLVRQAL